MIDADLIGMVKPDLIGLVTLLRSRNAVLEQNLAEAQRRARFWQSAHGEHCNRGHGCIYHDEEWVEQQVQRT